METAWRDLVLAARLLRKTPGFTLAAVLTLAIGIAASTAVFSVVNAALLRPYPYIDADRWANLYEQPQNEGLSGGEGMSVSTPNYRDWKQQSQSFAAMAMYFGWTYNLSGNEQEPERVRAIIITPDVFGAFGITPAAGRLLVASDEPAPNDPNRPIMISYGLWQRRFAGDPAIVGQKILLNLVPHTVVGVTPRDFTFPPNQPIDVFAPESLRAIATATGRDARGNQVSALLRPGVTWESARAEMDVIGGRLAAQYRENEGFGISIVPMRESITGSFRAPLLALLGALGTVMLLVCVNIANLQLVKLEARRRELAVRAALGASRGRLMRQALMESLLVALPAGAVGFALAPVCVTLLLTFVPSQHIAWLAVPTDVRVLLMSAGLTCAVMMIAGVLPAFQGVRVDLISVLARGGRVGTAAATSRHLRHAFVIAQLALSFVLVVGAALLVQSFIRLQRVHPGFAAEQRLTLSYTAPRARYPDASRLADLAERMRADVARAPGVVAAGAAQALPFTEGAVWFQGLSRTDPRGVRNLATVPHVHYNVVTTGYAEALGVPVKAGRTFTARDTATSEPVVVINDALASRYFHNENPIGQSLWVGHAQALDTYPRRTIIGVVGDARWSGLDTPAGPEAWVPISQQASGDMVFRTMLLVVHTVGDPAASASVAAIRAQIRGVDKDLALTSIRTLESRVDDAIWRQRLGTAALGALGIAALLIAVLGVFGVTSQLVGRRAHEIGVRLALGARPWTIIRLVMRESAWLVAIGLVIGVGAAFALARGVSSLLYGVTASDATTFAATAVGLAAAALLASFVPARRAARVDPLVTLRPE